MDEHIHRAITAGLRMRGVDVLTVQEDQCTGFPEVGNYSSNFSRTPRTIRESSLFSSTGIRVGEPLIILS